MTAYQSALFIPLQTAQDTQDISLVLLQFLAFTLPALVFLVQVVAGIDNEVLGDITNSYSSNPTQLITTATALIILAFVIDSLSIVGNFFGLSIFSTVSQVAVGFVFILILIVLMIMLQILNIVTASEREQRRRREEEEKRREEREETVAELMRIRQEDPTRYINEAGELMQVSSLISAVKNVDESRTFAVERGDTKYGPDEAEVKRLDKERLNEY